MTHPQPPFAGLPTPPARSRLAFWTRGPGIIAVIVAAGLLLFGLYALTAGLSARAAADDLTVDVTSCKFTGSEELPSAKVGIAVTNNGDKTRSVAVTIEYRDSGGNRLDSDTARIRNIAPGDTARTEETTLLDAGATSGSCSVSSVR